MTRRHERRDRRRRHQGEQQLLLCAVHVGRDDVALLVPWPLIHFTWWPSTWVYGVQLVTLLCSACRCSSAAGALLAGAEIDQTSAGAPAGSRTIPGAEPAHDGGPDGRSNFRLGGGASRRDPGRRRHRAEVPLGKRGRRSLISFTRDIGAGRAVDGFVAAVESVGSASRDALPAGVRRQERTCRPSHRDRAGLLVSL